MLFALELDVSPICLTRPNPIHKWSDSTRPDPTHNLHETLDLTQDDPFVYGF